MSTRIVQRESVAMLIVAVASVAAIFAPGAVVRADEPARPATAVELVSKVRRPSQNVLATVSYQPSKLEEPFFKKLAPAERVTGSILSDYEIFSRKGTYVGWFGIVREVEVDAEKHQILLTVEHKYFDGLTDSHQQTVSFNGAGEFQAVLMGTGTPIETLTLVKVYGPVASDKTTTQLHVEAEFVRNWSWRTFSFLSDYGKDRGNADWRKRNTVETADLYSSQPDTDYYWKRLGPRTADQATVESVLERVTPNFPLSNKDADTLRQIVAGLLTLDHTSVGGIQRPEKAPFSDATVAAVVELLSDRRPSVRLAAASYLEGSGLDTVTAVAPLTTALKKGDAEVRVCVATALWYTTFEPEPAISNLIELVGDEDSEVRSAAAKRLGEIGPEAHSACEALARALTDDDTGVRISVAKALVEIGGEEVRSPLLAALSDKNEEVRYHAAEALARSAKSDAHLIGAFAKALDDNDRFVRSAALFALQQKGSAAKSALPKLIQLLENAEDELGSLAIIAVGRVGAGQPAAVAPLLKKLKSEKPFVQELAVTGVGEVGPAAAAAIPALNSIIEARETKHERIAVYAAVALRRIDPHSDVPLKSLLDILAHGTDGTDILAADALCEFGAEAAPAVLHLTAMLANKDNLRKAAAARTLPAIGPPAHGALPNLVSLFESKSPLIRILVADAAWKLARDPKAIDILTTAVAQGWHQAIEPLGRIGPDAATAVTVLKTAQRDRDWRVRKAANDALRKIIP